MAKEIPYFKFYIGDWSNGDITLESFELQGVFINVCAYYWSKDCSVSLENVKKKFRSVSDSIDDLIKCNCIKKVGENISISFLNEQMESKEVQKAINRNNGSKGGRPPKEKTEEKPNRLFLQNPNITNIKKSKEEKSIEEYNSLLPAAAQPATEGVVADKKVVTYEEKKVLFIKLFNETAGREFRTLNDKADRQFKKLLSKGTTAKQFKIAITNAKKLLKQNDKLEYLSPEYITRDDKFDFYFNHNPNVLTQAPKSKAVS